MRGKSNHRIVELHIGPLEWQYEQAASVFNSSQSLGLISPTLLKSPPMRFDHGVFLILNIPICSLFATCVSATELRRILIHLVSKLSHLRVLSGS
jgi:hypothetical protein